ncbi:MAG: hypothetical protein MJE77_36375 [Proteobacteria bacterium]|nr:hypothetical protein [Pseudomonadota bacterium]
MNRRTEDEATSQGVDWLGLSSTKRVAQQLDLLTRSNAAESPDTGVTGSQRAPVGKVDLLCSCCGQRPHHQSSKE